MQLRIWLPLEDDWEEAKHWNKAEHLSYCQYKEEVEKAKDILKEKKGLEMEIYCISIGAMKAYMDDMGFRYDTPETAGYSVQLVMQSPFPVFERELQELAGRVDFC